MIGTHPTKMFNARLKQPGVRASIKGEVPASLVCSQTVKMRQRLFAMPSNAADLGKVRDQLLIPGAAPDDEALPNITDVRLKQVLLPWREWRRGEYLCVSPVPSGGVADELWRRLYDRKLPYRKWTIQPTPAARANHGDPLAAQAGAVRMLRRGAEKCSPSLWRGDYVSLTGTVIGMNISSGMVAVGWPALTAIGGLVHAMERETGLDLDFAIGMSDCEWQSPPKTQHHIGGKTKTPKPDYYTEEITARGMVALLVSRQDGGDLSPVLDAMWAITRIAGGSLFDQHVAVHHDSQPPVASYLVDASRDMKRSPLREDALDRALDMYGADGEWKLGEWVQPFTGYTLNMSGYALLEMPKTREKSRADYPHAWAEPVFSLTTQGRMNESAWWRRSCEPWGIHWKGAT